MTYIIENKQIKDAPWLVLLPGATAGAWLWAFSLQNITLPFNILCYNNPGVDGKPTENIRNVKDIAQDVLADMHQFNIHKAIIQGHSLGGFVAQELALRAPDRVDKLILVSTCMGQPWLARDFARLALNTNDYQQLVGEGEATETGARRILLGEKAQTERPAHIQDFIQTRAANWPRKDVRRLHTSVASHYASAGRAHEINQPTLVMHGAADVLVRPASAYTLAQQLRNARWLELAGVGHMPMIEAPDFWQYVTDFIHDEPVGQVVKPAPPLQIPLQDQVTAASQRIRNLWQQMKQNTGL